jgi:HK97 gp10 family phage protein
VPATLKSRLPEIELELEGRTREGLKRAAEMIEERAKDRVPVGYYAPHLREAIHVEEEEDGFRVVAGDSKVFYGHMIEFGTVKQPPRPFLLPAASSVLVAATVGGELVGLG